jgi:two-component sensor histidine kinase/CheY-like chemotaxis protein
MDQPINILIVDDEPRNLSVLETILDDPSYRLVRAESGEQALLALVAEEFALLILDIRMPGMSGFELAQMIKERKKTAQVPIIFLSAFYSEDEHAIEAYGSGAVDFLNKPVNATILCSKVAVFAELHRRQREIAAANRTLHAEVTDRRRAQELLHELNETLEQRVAERTAELVASLKEKEVLLAEVHHRVKNNLQVVDSLLNLQSGRFTDLALVAEFSSARERVRAMAAVHEQLYQTGDFGEVNLAEQLRELVRVITRAHAPEGVRLRCEPRLDPVTVDLNTAVPLSLIANELIVNAIKHAYAGRSEGELRVELRAGEEHNELCIADDGTGLPAGVEPTTTPTLGMRIVRSLARQVSGEVHIDSSPAGTRIRWPAQPRTSLEGGHSAGLPRAGEAVPSLSPVQSRSAPLDSGQSLLDSRQAQLDRGPVLHEHLDVPAVLLNQ